MNTLYKKIQELKQKDLTKEDLIEVLEIIYSKLEDLKEGLRNCEPKHVIYGPAPQSTYGIY